MDVWLTCGRTSPRRALGRPIARGYKARTLRTMGLTWTSLIVLLALCSKVTGEMDPWISKVTPSRGGSHGAVLITIFGGGFSGHKFNFGPGNEGLGVTVDLINDVMSYTCDVHREGCRPQQIQCYTRAMIPGRYYVRITVDGERVPLARYCGGHPYSHSCSFTATVKDTPGISSVEPLSGPPGTLVRFSGKIITAYYNSSLLSANTTNGVISKILRVYMGGLNCEMVDANTGFVYELELATQAVKTYEGRMSCLIKSRFIGAMNASFIIEAQYGRSKPHISTLKPRSNGKIGMFENYPDITSIYPSTGSDAGGTRLTIKGNYFDESDNIKITIAGKQCVVDNVTENVAICLTPLKPAAVGQHQAGGRGVRLEVWDNASVAFDQLSTISSMAPSDPGYRKEWVDELRISAENPFAGRLSGYFVPVANSTNQPMVKGTCVCKLYLSTDDDPSNKVERVSVDGSGGEDFDTWGVVPPEMVSGKVYYLEVLVSSGGDSGCWLEAAIFSPVSPYSVNQAHGAFGEIQKIEIVSDKMPEIQTIDLSGWPSLQPGVNETQRVELNLFSKEEAFRLGLAGTFTSQLTSQSTPDNIQNALMELSIVHTDKMSASISVVDVDTSPVVTIDITFESQRGAWPKVEALFDARSASNYSTEVVNAGEPSYRYLAVNYGDIQSPLLDIDSLNAETLQATIAGLLSVQCPRELAAPGGSQYTYIGYEGESPNDVISDAVWEATEEPFCGSGYAAFHSWTGVVWQTGGLTSKYANPILLDKYKWVCFAYRGPIERYLVVDFTYWTEQKVKRKKKDTGIYFRESHTKDLKSWHYSCIDLEESIKDLWRDADIITVNKLKIQRRPRFTEPVLIDSLYIGIRNLAEHVETLLLQRLVPSVRAQSVVVTEPSNGTYQITIDPHQCQQPILLSTNWVGASVSRTQTAPETPGGEYRLSWNGQDPIGVPVQATALELEDMLEAVPGMGMLEVTREGVCNSKTYTVQWLTNPGAQPLLNLESTSDVTGSNVQVAASRVSSGGLLHSPVLGHMLRTYHDTPQVRLYVNNALARSKDVDASFSWTAGPLPSITAFDPTTGTAGTLLTITGTDFNGDSKENNKVQIGHIPCTVTTATTTFLSCVVGDGLIGEWDVRVYVEVNGKATSSHGPFTYTGVVSGISPSTGGLGGGLVMTVTGTGFSEAITVTVGGEECVLKSASPTQVLCTVPQSTSSGVAQLSLIQNGATVLGPQFTYVEVSTPNVTSISPTTVRASGGEVVTIVGAGFGPYRAHPGAVRVGNRTITPESYSDTTIELTLPPLTDGVHSIHIFVKDKGFALLSDGTYPSVTVTFRVTSLSTTAMSVYGGVTMGISGEGLSTDPDVTEIKFGNVDCKIVSLSDTEAKCTVKMPRNIWHVDNKGKHPKYGTGYRWSPVMLEVEVGDIVAWTWEPPAFVQNVKYKVEQTDNITSTEFGGSQGFSSGAENTETGQFVHEFVEPGTYFYWSGNVTEWGDVMMRGQVRVTERTSTERSLVYSVNGVDAVQTGGVRRRKSLDSCSPPSTSGCTVSTPGDDFSVTFTDCYVSKVTKVSPAKLTTPYLLTISGSGFGTDNACIEVTVGGHPCVVAAVQDDQITCNLDPEDEAIPGQSLELVVYVGGVGYAYLAIPRAERYLYVLPKVASIIPNQGSVAGGTKVTITGSGFYRPPFGEDQDSPIEVPCEIESITYSKIICRTPRSNGANSLNLTVSVMGLMAECDACQFTYVTDNIPTMTSLEPASISVPATLTIRGTNFGTDTSTLSVTIDGITCAVATVVDDEIQCYISSIRVGENNVIVDVHSVGYADGDLKDVTVNAGGVECQIKSVTVSRVTCVSGPHAARVVSVLVVSDGITFPAVSYTYSDSATPTIASVTPSAGGGGTTISITGANFKDTPPDVKLSIGGVPCVLESASANELVCDVPSQSAGTKSLVVMVTGYGSSSGAASFTYGLSATGISPDQGSFQGGQSVTISGQGFHENITVTVCGVICELVSTSATETLCKTPAYSGSNTVICDVVVNDEGESATLPDSYTFSDSLTPAITQVSPDFGGTGGGTLITVTGTGFGTIAAALAVDIAGTPCDVQGSVTDSHIECLTGHHSPAGTYSVNVVIDSKGKAKQANASYEYVDHWSSIYSWGGPGERLPEEGDMVVIGKGQTLVLDQDTPILKMLLIQGGNLIFDRKDVELKAENILITDGGLLQIGTEEDPFQHKAIITMYGHVRQNELPVYGAKTLAVRQGALELHGRPIPSTWIVLGQTAQPGDTDIILRLPGVGWRVSDKIVIATTGGHNSQHQTETFTISAISSDLHTISLDAPLEYSHLGETQVFAGGTVLETRAEVGLLTRNIVFRGSNSKAWHDKIPACPEGFDNGQFATQTCFQGRFGEEAGTDQFGAAIMFHQPTFNAGEVVGHIAYVEITYAGQAFRLGRYPIHFHINGDMTGSYVKGCSIYETFNRAINIHNSHNILVEHNVIYDVMGGAVFLEDSIETGNVFQYNFLVHVKSSSSLLNDDITAAGFWINNPNNTARHNHVAGGTHFGFWYRMTLHPQGPSFDSSICPQHVPLTEFYNNTAHSLGWYGLWIFEEYQPKLGGACGDRVPIPAVFRKLTVYNSFRGAEWVEAFPMHFVDFVMANNFMAGTEHLFNRVAWSDRYTDRSGMVKDSVIISHLNTPNHPPCTQRGIVMPFGAGFLVKNVTFINFDGEKNGGMTCAALGVVKITCVCSVGCSAYSYKFKEIKWHNSVVKMNFEWEHQAELEDLDGTLTGSGVAGTRVFADSPLLPPSCVTDKTMEWSSEFPGAECPAEVNTIRMIFNKPQPPSLLYKDLIVSNRWGQTVVPFRRQQDTNKDGWMLHLVTGEEYSIYWRNAEHIYNISYVGNFNGLETGDYVVIRHNVSEENYDIIQIPLTLDPSRIYQSTKPLSFDNNGNGGYYYDSEEKELSYIVSSKPERGIPNFDRPVKLRAQNCYFKDCIDPSPENSPPPTGRPAEGVLLWSDPDSWIGTEDGWGGNLGNGQYGLPSNGEDVKIMKDWYMVVDKGPLPKLNKLIIYGILEIDNQMDNNGNPKDFTLEATYIIIQGGALIAGWPNEPYNGILRIILNGHHFTPQYPGEDGPHIGSKVIGVFGMLELHGKPWSVYWTRLSETASPGNDTIHLKVPVDWVEGDEIVIASTSYNASETEVFTIASVSDDNLRVTLNGTLKYRHLGHIETVGAFSVEMCAEVGLLTRNIKIEGAAYQNQEKEAFGGRVIVGKKTYIDGADVIAFRGYARLKNVEFIRSGQEGLTSSLTYSDTGIAGETRPSTVVNCSFHHGYSPAIEVFGAQNITLQGNVIHRVVGQGIHVEGSDHSLIDNLVTLSLSPGTFNGRFEASSHYWLAGIQTNMATDVLLVGNVVAGAERVGFRTDGEKCDQASRWHGNVAHSVLIGHLMGPDQQDCYHEEGMCSKFNDLTVYKAYSYGFYAQSECSVVLEGYKSIDNYLGVFTLILHPDSGVHKFADKYTTVTKSLFVGSSETADCQGELLSKTDPNLKLAVNGMSWRASPASGSGRIGLSWPLFNTKDNMFPEMNFNLAKGHPSLHGVMNVQDTTFAHFGPSCDNGNDRLFMTNPSSHDVQHPVHVKGLKLVDVHETSKVLIERPLLRLVNAANCVDMDCDGHKKAILKDLDGSFLGHKGTVIPDSAFEFNGDSRRGLGDYRIPKTLVTTPEGQRLNYSEVYDAIGIVRNEQSVWNNEWQAFDGPRLDYIMMVTENMDEDFRHRRLSPTAIRGSVDNVRYMDLLNGPGDHGVCHGYACRDRLGAYFSIVASGLHYDYYMTGTTPQHIRIHLLNTDQNQWLTLAVFYGKQQRLDVYYNDQYENIVHDDTTYIQPTNAEMLSGGKMKFTDFQSSAEYKQSITGGTSGSNAFDVDAGLLYLNIRGPGLVDIIMKPVIIIGFDLPTLSIDEFFSSDLIINNLATFLKIPPEKIRVMKVVSEAATRRRRQIGSHVTLEIGDHPMQPSPTDLDYQSIKYVAGVLAEGAGTGTLGDTLGVPVSGVSVTYPAPPPDSSEWDDYLTTMEESLGKPRVLALKAVDKLVAAQWPVPLHEGAAFSHPPRIKFVDGDGNIVTDLRSPAGQWQVEASLVTVSGHAASRLIGQTRVLVSDGWANFTDLGISHAGARFDLLFTVVEPSTWRKSIQFHNLTVPTRDLALDLSYQTTVRVQQPFTIYTSVVDKVTGQTVENITWRDHQWKFEVKLSPISIYKGRIESSTEPSFDPETGRVKFLNLRLSSAGRYVISVTASTVPSEYDLEGRAFIEVIDYQYKPDETELAEDSRQIQIQFDLEFSKVKEDADEFISCVYNRLIDLQQTVSARVEFNNFTLSEGSVLCDLVISGSTSHVISMMDTILKDISEGSPLFYNNTVVPYIKRMMVDGDTYNGTYYNPPTKIAPGGLSPGELAACIVVPIVFLLMCALLAFVVYYKQGKGKAKKGGMNDTASKLSRKDPPRVTVSPAVVHDKYTPLKVEASFVSNRGSSGYSSRASSAQMEGDNLNAVRPPHSARSARSVLSGHDIMTSFEEGKPRDRSSSITVGQVAD